MQREQQLLTEKLSSSLHAITSAYDPNSPNCRFQHLFYNKVGPAQRHLYTCPPNVSSKMWEEVRQCSDERSDNAGHLLY